jgi:GNAT superfamily N-acetyltransferase
MMGSVDVTTSQELVLDDGRHLRLRPLEPSDERAYRRFVASLSTRSQYYRFFSPRQCLTEGEIRHFLHVDHDRREAIAVLDGDEIVGIGRYDQVATRPSDAEVAFVVRDEYQGRGIAPRLLDELASVARPRGIRHFTATVLADNRRMLKVFARSDWLAGRRLEDGAVAVTLDIDRPNAQASGKA